MTPRVLHPNDDERLVKHRSGPGGASRIAACALASAVSACSSWTSLHVGYGRHLDNRSSEVAGEVTTALGGATIDSGFGLVGAQVSGASNRLVSDIHFGAMRPWSVLDELALTPLVAFELARVARIDGGWYGGSLAPRGGVDATLWVWNGRRRVRTDIGCMGGAEGVDCPRCYAWRSSRDGVSVRVTGTGPVVLGNERLEDWTLWFTVGATHAVSAREEEQCRYDVDRLPTLHLRRR